VTTTRAAVARTIRQWVIDNDIEGEWPTDTTCVAVLPGDHKLRTAVSLVVGEHSLSIDAFVMRHPEDNVGVVHQWLLERNAKLALVSYSIDHLGDVYLTGRIPLAVVTVDVLDAVMGQVLEASDGPFNFLLELGFETAIVREWQWRLDRGESTANLAPFDHLRPSDDQPQQS